MVGSFKLHRFCGTEVFELTRAFAVPDLQGTQWSLSLEARTDGRAISTLPDTAELEGSPRAEITLRLPRGTDLFGLKGLTLSVPHGCDESKDEDLATFYYVEHDYLDNNVV